MSVSNHLNPKIVVIGGGLSGLTAAYRLKEKNADVELYEGRNRLGGRVFTALINGEPGELGGQNLYDGGKSGHILNLIEQLGLKTEFTPIRLERIYHHEGQKYDFYKLIQDCHFNPQSLKDKLQELADSSKNMQ